MLVLAERSCETYASGAPFSAHIFGSALRSRASSSLMCATCVLIWPRTSQAAVTPVPEACPNTAGTNKLTTIASRRITPPVSHGCAGYAPGGGGGGGAGAGAGAGAVLPPPLPDVVPPPPPLSPGSGCPPVPPGTPPVLPGERKTIR